MSEQNFSGSIRIRNPKTLQRWIDKGWYQREIEAGYMFNIGCGRFRAEKCECRKCKKSKNSPLKEVLEANNITINN